MRTRSAPATACTSLKGRRDHPVSLMEQAEQGMEAVQQLYRAAGQHVCSVWEPVAEAQHSC